MLSFVAKEEKFKITFNRVLSAAFEAIMLLL